MYAKYTQPGKNSTSAIGRHLGSNLLDCLLMAKAKNVTIIPSWNNMHFFNSHNFDIAPFLFTIPDIHDVSLIDGSESIFLNNSPLFNNFEFMTWLRDCLQTDLDNTKLSKLCLFGFPGYNQNLLYKELRFLFKSNICKINTNIIDDAYNYINNTLPKKYLSIHFRVTDLLNAFKIVDKNIYNKLIQEFINTLRIVKNKNFDAVYIASCSYDGIKDIQNIIKKELNVPIYSLPIERISNNINTYSKDQTISYYANTIKELIVLSKGSYFIRSFPGKYSLIALIMSNLTSNKIYTLTDNIIENIFLKMYEKSNDFKAHVRKNLL